MAVAGHSDKFVYLQMVDLFQGLNDEELRECEVAFPMIRAPEGQILFTPVSSEQALYIIKEGDVRLYRLSSEGREVTLGVLSQNDVFGTLPMFGALSHNTFAQAASNSVLCILREEHLHELIRRHPEIAIRLLQIVGERLALAEDQIEDLAFRPAEERVARSIMLLAEQASSYRLSVSHEDIAKLAGVARETVTKVLGSMERRGWVSTGYRRIKLLKPKRIKEQASNEISS